MMSNEKIEFVSYTGKYPNLCSGVLTVRIDGKEVKFGYDIDYKTLRNRPDVLPKFWITGGACGFTNGYSDSYVNHAPWELLEEALPPEYKEIGQELIDLFNKNVPEGCCGGCL